MAKRKLTPEYASWLADVRRRLVHTRESLGLSLRDAGEKTGVHFSNIAKREKGVVAPSHEFLLRMAKGYGVPLSALKGLDDPPKVAKPRKARSYMAVSAGPPVAADDDEDMGQLTGPGEDAPPGCVRMRVVGGSMAGAGIHDQDVVYVRPENDPSNLKRGQIVVARTEDGRTLKAVDIREDGIWLVAMYENVPPLRCRPGVPDGAELIGVVIETRGVRWLPDSVMRALPLRGGRKKP